jgi:branched-chain amino acid transport system ATP-binding protein
LGIIGPNGAGKSTMLGVISAFHPATKGKIIFDGIDITKLKPHQIVRLRIARNFQAATLFMNLKVLDNVISGFHTSFKTNVLTRLFHLPEALREKEAFRQKGIEILKKMGIGALKDELAKNLPYGYQRILGVCIAMATNPKLLLLDEPVTGMNQTEIQTMEGLIREIRESGVTVIIVEHNMRTVLSLCDRLVVLDLGQKIWEGLPKDMLGVKKIIEAYLGKEGISNVP